MNQIKQDILNKIKKGEIKKTSSWYFATKDYFFKAMFAVSVVLGSIGFSSALVQLFVKPEGHMEVSFTSEWIYYFAVSAPYLWMLFLVLFTLIAWINFKNTEDGYKKDNKSIVLVSVILSIILGSALFASGGGKRVDDEFQNRIKPYKNFQEMRMKHRKEVIQRLSPEQRKELREDQNESIPGMKKTAPRPQ